MVVEKGFNVNMAANGKTNSALCSNNWVKKLHATEMQGAIFAYQTVLLLQVCVRNVVLSTNVLCEKVVET